MTESNNVTSCQNPLYCEDENQYMPYMLCGTANCPNNHCPENSIVDLKHLTAKDSLEDLPF